MEATVLSTFVDRKLNKRFDSGDVVNISKNDFDRISAQGKYLKAGRHRFGSGICHPCSKKSKNK